MTSDQPQPAEREYRTHAVLDAHTPADPTLGPAGAGGTAVTPARRRRLPTAELIAAAILATVFLQRWIAPLLDFPALQTWSTIFVSLMVQATPFLVLGVLVSGAVAAFLPPGLLGRILPNNDKLAVTGATCAGFLLPGCECASVPISGRLMARGALPAAALAFMLAAPAINPIVLISTAVAFPGQPRIVLARFLASFLTAVVVGLVWVRMGSGDRLVEMARRRIHDTGDRLGTFVATSRHDFLHAGGYLVIGAGVAASIQVVVPAAIVDTIAGSGVLAVLVMATLAIVLSICSEADAFVAASLPQFSMTSRLVFMVVGPVVDIKLVALQAGVFGRGFAARFAPLTLVVAVTLALLFGWWLL